MTVIYTKNKNRDALGSTLISNYYPFFLNDNLVMVINDTTYDAKILSMACGNSKGVFWAYYKLTAIHNRN